MHCINATGSALYVIKGEYTYNLVSNCYAYNSSVTDDQYAIGGIISNISFCEAKCTNGYAISAYSIYQCFAYESAVGLYNSANGSMIKNVVSNCTIGIYKTGRDGSQACDNTLYNCPTGIYDNNTYYGSMIYNNNIVSSSVKGIDATGAIQTGIAGNNFYDMTGTRNDSTTYELSYSELDPDFIDDTDDNFEPQNKLLIGEAYPTTFVGTNTTNQNVAGACQLDASGGGQTSYVFEN